MVSPLPSLSSLSSLYALLLLTPHSLPSYLLYRTAVMVGAPALAVAAARRRRRRMAVLALAAATMRMMRGSMVSPLPSLSSLSSLYASGDGLEGVG